MNDATQIPLTARRGAPLRGRIRVPGDKSISHRALILGALTVGETTISGLLEGDDVLHTAQAMRALGARIERTGDFTWRVQGVGTGGFAAPKDPLDFGNSGTGVRLAIGAVAGSPVTATFIGDASLSGRPMRRVLDPLEKMGARVIEAADGGRLPLTLQGAADPMPITYESPVPSAQLKSAVLLAGLSAPGETTVVETEATRDHTERLMKHFGAKITSKSHGEHGRRITLQGQPELEPANVVVPADPSSAAFPMVAALIVPPLVKLTAPETPICTVPPLPVAKGLSASEKIPESSPAALAPPMLSEPARKITLPPLPPAKVATLIVPPSAKLAAPETVTAMLPALAAVLAAE